MALDIPRQPAAIRAEAGKVVSLPPGTAALNNQETQKLIMRLRKSELKQARLARAAVNHNEAVRASLARGKNGPQKKR